MPRSNPKRAKGGRVVEALLREHAEQWLAKRERPDLVRLAMLAGELNTLRYLPELPRRSKAKP